MGMHSIMVPAMASRWRRRTVCTLDAGAPVAAVVRDISATGAFVETPVRPMLGATVELLHPEAGTIFGIVSALASDGIRIDFDCREHSVAFALAAITADMSRPAL